MTLGSARSRSRRSIGGVVLVVGLLASLMSPVAVRAAADDDLPPDDGAPPSDDAPSPGALTLQAEPSVLPSSPPADNAFPVSGRSRSSCTDSFGDPRSGGRTHMGVDCFAPLGTPLLAVEAGAIRYATPGDPFSCVTGGDISGNRVSLRGRSGYVYYYGHLDTIAVTADQQVERGQVIGTLGRTGNATCSSPHLHFEVKCGDAGEPFDPFPLMATWGRDGTQAPAFPNTDLMGVGVVSSGLGRQDLFALQCGQVIRQKMWQSTTGFSPGWNLVDGIAASDPDAASTGPDALPQMFVRGVDRAAYQLQWDGSVWVASNLEGICTSGATAAYSSPSHLDVFCRGTDFALYHRVWDRSTGWTAGWSRVGGIATSDPDATSPGPEYPTDVFVRGSDAAVYQLQWNGAAWMTYALGGICTSGPSATYSGPHRLDVFCRGLDLALYHRSWRSDIGWSTGWSRIESRVLSDPEATSPGPGRPPQVFVRGMDRRIYQFQLTSTGWVIGDWGVT